MEVSSDILKPMLVQYVVEPREEKTESQKQEMIFMTSGLKTENQNNLRLLE